MAVPLQVDGLKILALTRLAFGLRMGAVALTKTDERHCNYSSGKMTA